MSKRLEKGRGLIASQKVRSGVVPMLIALLVVQLSIVACDGAIAPADLVASSDVSVVEATGEQARLLDGHTVSGVVSIAVDPHRSVSTVEFSILPGGASTGAPPHVDGLPPFEFELDTTTLPDGPNALAVVALNRGGTVKDRVDISFVVDNGSGSGDPEPEPTPPPDPEPGPEPGPGSNVTLPARSAFYYPWYPETWSVGGEDVFYRPILGTYDSDDVDVVDAHLAMMDYAKIDVAIASWWGASTHDESVRVPLLLDRTLATGAGVRWAIYYEKEGNLDPSVSELKDDLAYLGQHYASSEAFARVEGRPVVFVYNADDTSCDVADRWAEAAGDAWHVVLKVFSGYRDCARQPLGWHQYSPAVAAGQQDGFAYYISPGFWRADEPSARLERDPDRWRMNVRDMIASGEPWQLVATFNEWGEGTAVEEAHEWSTGGFGIYLDALANDGAEPPSEPEPDPPPPTGDSVSFAVAGDIGGKEDRAGIVLPHAEAAGAEFFVVPGDMSYDEITPESAWCDWIETKYANPFQIVAGNHEEDSRVDGYILDFAACLPDRMNSTLGPGGYAVNYFFDVGPVRVIAISANLTVAGVDYDYDAGSSQRSWLQSAIRGAPGWTVVTTHKPCLSIGNKSCEIGDSLMDFLHAEGVDLLVFGHDHDYQRSHSLSCANPGSFDAGCIADSGSDGEYARDAGTVHVISGTVGRSPTTCSHSDSEYGYFAAHRCAEESSNSQGYLLVTVSETELHGEFVGVFDGYRDVFAIR